MKMIKRTTLLFVSLYILAVSCSSPHMEKENESVIESENLSQIERSIIGGHYFTDFTLTEIQPNSLTTKTFNATTLGNRVILSLNAKINHDQMAGAANFMRVHVNNELITSGRLVNKPNQFTFRDGRTFGYFGLYGTDSNLTLFYANNFYENNLTQGGYGVIGGQATLYEFDITDLVSSGDNEVIFTNTSSNKSISIAGVSILNRISTAPNRSIAPNSIYSTNFIVSDINKKTMIRHNSRLEYYIVAGADSGMQVLCDNVALTISDLINKPQNAYSYPNSTTKGCFTYIDGRVFPCISSQNKFTVQYSPNMTANDYGSEYEVIGGEAYRWDLLIPEIRNTIGEHAIIFKNVTESRRLIVEDIEIFEMQFID